MNWTGKIKNLTNKIDNSPELKKGEIKNILLEIGSEILPEFKFLTYKNSCYIFQRIRRINELTVSETLHIIFTLKDRNFACSIASRLSPLHIYFYSYNNGIINPHIDLKVLKHDSGILSIDEAYYFHNGRVETTTKIIKEIFCDYKKFGIPFLERHFQELQSNRLIKIGLDFIQNLNIDKKKLEIEISTELKKANYLISGIEHEIYNDLKETLQKVDGQSIQDRRLIPKTAYELLEIYWT